MLRRRSCQQWHERHSPSIYCQLRGTLEAMISNVAVLVYDGVAPFELGVLHESWGCDRSDEGLPVMDFAICAATSGPVRTQGGFDLLARHDLARAAEADLVAVPAMGDAEDAPVEVLDALRAAHARGARVLSLCTGAFVLGQAGPARRPLLHHPLASLRGPGPPVPGGAGAARGALRRRRPGAHQRRHRRRPRRLPVPVARGVRRGRRQRRRPADGRAAAAGGRPGAVHPLTRARLRRRDARARCWSGSPSTSASSTPSSRSPQAASMSPRTFARRFRAETGTTPHVWLTSQRVLRAEELLETTDRLGRLDRRRGRVRHRRDAAPPLHEGPVGQPAAVPPHLQLGRRLAGLTRDRAGRVAPAGAPCRWR